MLVTEKYFVIIGYTVTKNTIAVVSITIRDPS